MVSKKSQNQHQLKKDLDNLINQIEDSDSSEFYLERAKIYFDHQRFDSAEADCPKSTKERSKISQCSPFF